MTDGKLFNKKNKVFNGNKIILYLRDLKSHGLGALLRSRRGRKTPKNKYSIRFNTLRKALSWLASSRSQVAYIHSLRSFM